ncbi:zinc finger protein 84-like [Ochotona princeps]|uniref:zinc finger protein 84-like n=1 Tax=Ochotona princeps TaxID=9978 RepID=UPI002714C3BA|nr:zinc finger protein 84-like [Ochotona princeps]
MDNTQRTLYRDVMLETYSNLLFLGYHVTKPDVILKLEQDSVPWTVDKSTIQRLPDSSRKNELLGVNQKSQEIIFRMPDEMPLEITHPSNFPEKKLQNGGNLSMHTCQQSFEHSGKEKTWKKRFLKCEKVYTNDLCNKQHINVGETIQVKKQMFRNNPDYDNHQQTQSGEKPHGHFQSEKSLICKRDAKVNQITQTARSQYICDYWKKPFNCESRITMNQRTDKGENFCMCNQCKENIDQKSELLGGQILDTAEKPNECSDPGKALHQQLSVIGYQRIHIGGKCYECVFVKRQNSNGKKHYE